MKRTLFNPGGVLNIGKRVLDPLGLIFKDGGGGAAAPASSASATRATETSAGEEATRRANSDAATRAGARASLLTDANLADTFGSTPTKRKSLLGG